jgi:integrase
VIAQRKGGTEDVKRLYRNFRALLQKPLHELTQWTLDKWRSERKRADIAAATINRDVANLKACLSRAVKWGVIETHPLTELKPFSTDRRPLVRYLSETEERRLRRALAEREERLRQGRYSGNEWRATRGYPTLKVIADNDYADHLQPMVLLALNTGMRRGEIFALTWGHVNFDQRMLTVAGANAKSGNTRHIPLNDESVTVLKRWRGAGRSHGLVFPSDEGKPFNNIRKSFEGILKAARIRSFRFHDLRHHFASQLVMRGVDLNTVRELLGHSDLKMTLRYAHLAPEHKAAAVARLGTAIAG